MLYDLIQLPEQNLTYLSQRLAKLYQFLTPIHQTPMMTTEQYISIYPFVAHHLYQSLTLTPYDTSLFHLSEDENMTFSDSIGIALDGFYIAEHRTAKTHTFVFTYEGTWLYNHEPMDAPKHIQEYINKLVCNSYECMIYNKPIKENLFMNNIERLQMEIAGIELPHEELLVYLDESGVKGYNDYNASSRANKKAIYESALSVLHSIANQPHLMKNYKQDDMTIDSFGKYLQSRIEQLEKKIRQMPDNDSESSNFFNLFQ